MKKYGDDADQFHNQGTRVEASKKWHEQNQLKHDYSYRSVSKPYYRSYNKKDNKPKNIYKTRNTPYTQFNESNFKPNWSCAPNYDENYYERNKHVGNKHVGNKTNKNYGWVVGLCCIVIIIFFAICLKLIF